MAGNRISTVKRGDVVLRFGTFRKLLFGFTLY